MQVTVEAGEGLARRMTVELPADDVEQQVDKKLRDVARQARLPGFRPGKVPMRVLRQRFGDSVRGEVLGEMMQSSFSEAIAEQELRPLGRPDIEPDIDAGNHRYAYTARFEVLPEIELNDLGGKRIVRPVAEVTDADLERVIERLREQRKTFAEVDRGARQGDRLTISFQGSIDGESFEGGSAEHRRLVLGSSGFIPGFEQQLEGAAAGEERVVEVSFPADYHAEQLAGKPAQFKVQVEAVAEPRLPEVDADFVAAYGISDGDIERFRVDVRANMERNLRQRIAAKVKSQVMDALIAANPVALPAVLVAEEIQSLKRQAPQAAGAAELPDEHFADAAERRVQIGLVTAEVVKRYELTPSPERVRARLEEMAATYDRPEEVINYYHADPKRMSAVEGMAMEDMVVERMLETAEVVEEASSFEALTEQSDG